MISPCFFFLFVFQSHPRCWGWGLLVCRGIALLRVTLRSHRSKRWYGHGLTSRACCLTSSCAALRSSIRRYRCPARLSHGTCNAPRNPAYLCPTTSPTPQNPTKQAEGRSSSTDWSSAAWSRPTSNYSTGAAVAPGMHVLSCLVLSCLVLCFSLWGDGR